MRQRRLLAVAWAIAATILGSAILFAASAQDAGPVFAARCGRCHTPDDVATRLRTVPPDTVRAFVPALLGRHFAPPEADRAALSDYLLGLATRP